MENLVSSQRSKSELHNSTFFQLYTHHRILILATKNICFYNPDEIHTPIWMKIEPVYSCIQQLQSEVPNKDS